MADPLDAARRERERQQDRLARQIEKDAVLRMMNSADGTDVGMEQSGQGSGALIVAGGPNAYDEHHIYLKSKRPLMAKVSFQGYNFFARIRHSVLLKILTSYYLLLKIKVKEVVEYIAHAKKVVSSFEIREKLKYDLNTDDMLLQELSRHPQINVVNSSSIGQRQGKVDGDSAAGEDPMETPNDIGKKRLYILSFVPTFDVRSRAELLQALERLPDGIAVKDLVGSYQNVLKDIKELNAKGDIFVVRNIRVEIALLSHPCDLLRQFVWLEMK